MGQEASKNLRSQLEYKTLEELLVDDKVIKELERHPIQQSLRKNLARILASSSKSKVPSNGTKHRGKLAPLYSLLPEDISNIPQDVQDSLCNFHHQYKSWSSDDLLSPSSHYEFTCTIKTALFYNRIVWRFLTTFYHDIVSALGNTIQRHSNPQHVGIAFVVEKICRVAEHDREVVRNNIQAWVKIGRRYRGLMNELGSGSLILFPKELSDSIWEQYLPMKGNEFEEAIKFLRNLGLVSKCQKEGWNVLGDQIMQTLSGPFQFLSEQQLRDQRAAPTPPVLPNSGRPDIHGHPHILDSRRLAPCRVSKTIQKKKIVKRQTPQRAPLATTPHDNPSLLPLVAFNDQGRDPFNNVPLHVTNVYQHDTDLAHHMARSPTSHQGFAFPELPLGSQCQMGQSQNTRESVSDTLRLARTGISTISALLNYDESSPIATTLTAQESDLVLTGQQLGDDGIPVCVPTTSLTAPDRSIHDQRGNTADIRPESVDFSVLQGQDKNQVQASRMNIAEVGRVDRLGDTLGGYLFENMSKSKMRCREIDEGMMSFTQTVRLHFGYRGGEDFKLEVWLCSSAGTAISQAKMRSVEDLKGMLGNYLFDAMKASIWRQSEEIRGPTDYTRAVDVSFQNGEEGSDCILRVMLSFVMGVRVFGSIYPGTE